MSFPVLVSLACALVAAGPAGWLYAKRLTAKGHSASLAVLVLGFALLSFAYGIEAWVAVIFR